MGYSFRVTLSTRQNLNMHFFKQYRPFLMRCIVVEEFKPNLFHISFIIFRFVNAFKDEIRYAVEKAITKKITEGTSKLDSLLRTLPKKIDVHKNVALNVTFVNDPVLRDSSIEFDINGLFIPSDKASRPRYLSKNLQTSVYCLGASKMLGISLDETVFNSASLVFFQVTLSTLHICCGWLILMY